MCQVYRTTFFYGHVAPYEIHGEPCEQANRGCVPNFVGARRWNHACAPCQTNAYNMQVATDAVGRAVGRNLAIAYNGALRTAAARFAQAMANQAAVSAENPANPAADAGHGAVEDELNIYPAGDRPANPIIIPDDNMDDIQHGNLNRPANAPEHGRVQAPAPAANPALALNAVRDLLIEAANLLMQLQPQAAPGAPPGYPAPEEDGNANGRR